MNDPFRFIVTRPRSDRRGFALIAVLVVMVVLGLIGGAALKLTAGDQKVTRLFADANQADGAATAGLEHALAVFQANGAFPVASTINGYSYTVSRAVDMFDYKRGKHRVALDVDGHEGLVLGRAADANLEAELQHAGAWSPHGQLQRQSDG
jgi:Tfp pilus assembly protein PilX